MFSGARRSPVSLLLLAAYTTWLFTRTNTPESSTTKPAERRIARSGRNMSAPPSPNRAPEPPHHESGHTGTGRHEPPRRTGTTRLLGGDGGRGAALAVVLGRTHDHGARVLVRWMVV